MYIYLGSGTPELGTLHFHPLFILLFFLKDLIPDLKMETKHLGERKK